MSLAHLLKERWEECEADLRRFYGLSLREVVYGSSDISWRELLNLLKRVPEDGALKSRDGWTTTHELAAVNAEVGHALLLAVMGIGGVKKLPKPLHIPRPGEKPGARRRRGPRPGAVTAGSLQELERLAGRG